MDVILTCPRNRPTPDGHRHHCLLPPEHRGDACRCECGRWFRGAVMWSDGDDGVETRSDDDG